MGTDTKTFWTETLPDPLPANPLAVAAVWLEHARSLAQQPNPNAMVLASVDGEGRPSARVVLCKAIVPNPGYIVFYTNYDSRKGSELKKNPHAAVVFHWDHLHRQIRIEGRVERMSEAENDAYFHGRAWQSRVGAWASQQSRPIDSRAALAEAVKREAQKFGIDYGGPGTPEPSDVKVDVPRPPYWGGFKLMVDAVELWVEGEFRIHDRARWSRSANTPNGVSWTATRLQP